MIILQHNQRSTLADFGHFDNLISELTVNRHVPVTPRVPRLFVDVRCAWSVPEIVLEEPEERVRDPIVIAVVRVRIGQNEAKADVGVRGPDHGFAGLLSLQGTLTISVGHGAGDPCQIAEAADCADRGDDAATSSFGAVRAILFDLEFDRAAVRGDDQSSSFEEVARAF